MVFSDKLKLLNMEPQSSGLRLVSDKNKHGISETERRILNIAEKDYKADAVYFSKSGTGNSTVAQIFIYDNTANRLNDDSKIKIHKQIWSSEIVPLYYIFEKTQLLIINGKQKISIINNKENFAETVIVHLDYLHDIEQSYDALKHPYKGYFFDNASFWDTEVYRNQFITKQNPFTVLIDYLKELKKAIELKVTPDVLNRLIVQCILVKYLEEKQDENGKNVFTIKNNILQDNWQSKDFTEIIKKEKLLNLFDYLASHYNGKVFEWSKNKEVEERNEVAALSRDVLDYLAAYFDGNYNFKKQNYSFWRYYSFQYLPVELISRIYEEFLPNMPGVVYTPPFLVDFLVDECMPIEDYKKFENGKFKILDPSLGSGIFCVSAYKRLIDWYKINRYHKEGISWTEPVSNQILKNILKDNIFGTDVEKPAVRIAIFSLTLALLENLAPLQILEDLKFDDLSKENILNENFFSFFNKHKDNPDFDLVIGNPPFNAPDKISNGNYLKKLKKELGIEVSHKIPDDNLALVFLDRATLLSKPNGEGLTCLILPSAPLLYGKWSQEYRNHFLQKFYVPQIIDFTHLRRILFNKDVSAAAIFVKNETPDLKKKTWHVIANRTKKEQNRLFFLFDHYDFHVIGYKRALNERYVWKTNLVGGGRLGRIVERLSKIERTVLNFLEQKTIERGWAYADGYIIGTNNKNKTANYITDSFTLPNEALTDLGIDYSKIFQEKETDFNNISNEKAFQKPQILIKRIISEFGKIPIIKTNFEEVEKYKKNQTDINKNKLCFKDGVLGIHYNSSDKSIIDGFISRLRNEINLLNIYLTSAAVLIRKEGALKKTDIDNLPYPEDESELELSEVETVWRDDVLNYYIHQAKSPDTNPLNKDLGGNAKKQIQDYGYIFCKVMNASYSLKPECSFRQGESFETDSYIATCFHYTDKDIEFSYTKSNEQKFKDYFSNQTGRNQQITRIVKYYHGDSIWFIKPRQMRYWLKSIGDRDAIDCINDILNKGKNVN